MHTKKMEWTFGLALCAAVCLVGGLRAAPTALSPADGKTVDLLTENQRGYLALDEAGLRATLLSKDTKYAKGHPEAVSGAYRLEAKPSPLVLSWKDGKGACRVDVVRTADGVSVASGTSKKGTFAVYNLELGCDYRWTVTDETGKAEATFRTSDQAPRLLNGGAVANVRDLGGWKGLDGRRIVQGRVFRTAGLNKRIGQKDVDRAKRKGVTLAVGEFQSRITDENRAVFTDVMKLKADVDLRFTNEVAGMVSSPAGTNVTWLSCPLSGYYPLRKSQAKALHAIFDPANHPVAFHCAAGKDRTGTVSAYVLGILGASDADIMRDYGMTDDRLSARFCQFMDSQKKTYKADTFAQASEAHFKKLGFADEEIARFRSVMLR